MIASTAVGRWTWGREDESGDPVLGALHALLGAHRVLAAQGFAVGATVAQISVRTAGSSDALLFDGEVPLDGQESAQDLARTVTAALRPGEIGSVHTSVTLAGEVRTAQNARVEQGIFRLGSSALLDFVTTDLTTFTDIWLPYDLKGRAQPDVYEANGHRLTALLGELADALGTETEPDDPTWFARPSEQGINNYFDQDGAASDVWGSFEVPYRNRVFQHSPVFDSTVYGRSAEGEVQYLPVVGEHVVLGYLWASDAERAASFEPRDAAEEDGYKAGLSWLDRLGDAAARGLRPTQALAELRRLPADGVVGSVPPDAEPSSAALSDLREHAATDHGAASP
ncbi:hypothetical protein H9Y04_26265 [Streptomyces sp. TRM66268-LWL]|uniref:Uncharacterized protein n=1 Tax=Streptomyces polyasparticus TaxID=2767826 RepID=A0ABR7SNA5_9ACTN|nr:hypothetical protein [Streptomyces polyasparticus]MBC9716052.1 hypothetical protein [Streptomyces polyasparticus]